MHRLTFMLSIFLICTSATAAQVKLAVAANFTAPMREIAARFAEATGHQALVSYGSTGKLYAQIRNGAPFHVFLAADRERPRLVYESGLGGEPKTYAIGRLVLWSHDAELIEGSEALGAGEFARIAIANPKTAPYGSGALQILETLGVKDQLKRKLVKGDNIAQTYQFVMTENAQLGFVALSQVTGSSDGSSWVPPQSMYDPLHQDMVLLTQGSTNPAALAFVDFLLGDEAQQIARRYGYGTD
jgi:molybdate transport system substrate-binding protein